MADALDVCGLVFSGELDEDGEMLITEGDDPLVHQYIMKHDAKKITQHLTDVFELEQE